MQNLRNIIVTGSNKGIGYGIVENLAQKEGWNIIMACRNVELAIKSRDELKERFPNAHISTEQLDVTNNESIQNFLKIVAEKYNKIDVLINNAGVAAKGDAFDVDVFDFTFGTNFYGTVNFTEQILKYIADSGKVIFVGSMAGKLTRIKSQEIKNRFRNPELTKEQLYELLGEFKQAVLDGNVEERGWPKWIYGISKVGINHYARVLSRFEEVIDRKIQVYALCPGYVDTDMTSHKGILTIQQGALTAVHCTELPFEVNPEFQGKFFEKSALSSLE